LLKQFLNSNRVHRQKALLIGLPLLNFGSAFAQVALDQWQSRDVARMNWQECLPEPHSSLVLERLLVRPSSA
jgi:hypothetical protein